MIKKLLKIILEALVAFCIGRVLALLISYLIFYGG